MREMAQGSTRDGGGQFPVESYLHYHGEEIVKRFDANCYLYLTKMMDLHDIGAGRGGPDEAWKRFSGRRLLGLGLSSDMLFPNPACPVKIRNRDPVRRFRACAGAPSSAP